MPEPHRRTGRTRPTRRSLLAALTLALVGTILVAGATPASAFPTKLSTNGQMDFVFGAAVNSAGGSGGTVYKPESKLFYTGDGTSEAVRWWAVLGTSGPSPAAGVWLFELVSHQWVARVQLPGSDPWAKADALFEGGTLYVSTRDELATSGANIRQSSLYKIPYNGSGTWGAVQGPFAITTGSLETLTLARDSTNRLWVTYESAGQIRVGYTAPGGTSFTFITVSQTNVVADDISTITAFGGNRIGVFWSDQNAKKDFFAWRLDSTVDPASGWTIETAYGGGVGGCPSATSDICGDDHMNLKVYQDQIYVSIKSGLNDAPNPNPNDPLNLLLRRSSGGTWSAFPVSTVSQNVTRPITLLSPEQDKIWVWGTRGAEVDVWESSFSAPSFNSTDFVPWTKGAGRSPADATATKQLTTAATGAVVMSSTSSAAEYWHNEFLPVVPPPPNQLPTFDQDLPNRTDAEGAAISLPSPATDPEDDTLTYAATGLPNGLSIDSGTGTISGTIGYQENASSPFSVSVTVSDDGGTTVGDTDTFTWTVTNTNRLPTFDQDLPNRTDAEGAAITLPSPATDLDDDTLTYAATGLPDGLSINPNTGTIFGTIANTAAAGSPYSTSITVSDDGGTTVGATDTFTWTVDNTNQPPTFDQDLPDRTDREGDEITLLSPATDPDEDTLTYDATGLPPGLTINPNTGTISGTISLLASLGSPYSVSVTVSDDGGTTVGDTDTFEWTVRPANQQPTFLVDLPDRTDAENDSVTAQPFAVDLDFDTLTYSATGLPPGLSINPNTGEISGTIGYQANADSPYSVSVTVSDDGGTTVGDTDTFTWTVTNTNRLPTFDQDLPNRTDAEGAAITLPSPATDLDDDTLTYAATGLPDGLSINPNTGTIFGTISAGAATGSPYSVSVTVSDDGGTTAGDTDPFDWTVTPPNQLPTFDQDLPNRTDAEGAAISLPSPATDPEDDTLTYAATGLPNGLSIDSGTGTISGTIGYQENASSPFSVSVTVSDDGGTTVGDTDTFTWTVTNTNRLPTFDQDLPNRTDAEGAAITLPSPATDLDDDTLTYAATGLPDGLSINPNNGTISGTIANTAAAGSPYSTSITVSDDGGTTVGATDTFTWTVTAAPAQITFRSVSSAANAVATSLTIPKPATVANGDVMVAVIDVRQTPTATAPAGWSQVSMTPNGSTFRQYVFTKVATGSEPVSYTFTFNQSRAASGAILAYSGVSTTTPVEAFTAGTGSGTGITAPSATTLSNGAMVVGAFSINNGSAVTQPAGMTERAEVASSSKIKTEVADVVQAAAGATGAKTATAASGTANIGQLIVLKPGSGGGGGPNQDPTFDQNLGNRSDAEGAVISLSAHATDPENDTLTYAATGLPTGLSINTATGLITGTISAGASTNSPFSTSITVSDDNFATVGATDTFTWTVTTGGGGGGSITFRSASFGANNVGSNVVIPTPAGVQTGDVMVAVIDAKAGPTITTPAGWTLLSTTPHGSNFKQAVYSRVATGSEPASTTWTINQSRAISGGIVAYSGVNTSNPVEILGTAGTGTTASITAPSVTSALNGAMVIGAFGINADSTIAPPAGMTERGEIVSATRIRTEISDVVLASAGATGAKTATAAAAAANIGQLIVLRPA